MLEYPKTPAARQANLTSDKTLPAVDGTSTAPYRGIVPGQHVYFDQPARVAVPAPRGSTEPQIEVVREGNVVKGIYVRCPCGHCIHLVCDYGDKNAL